MSEQKQFEIMMTEEEILIMTRITQSDAPHSQRAQALLAVGEGKTLAAAAAAAGLRDTQVKYWVARYRKSGLAIFPDDLLTEETDVEVINEIVEAVDMAIAEETAVSLEKSAEIAAEQAPTEQKEEDKKKKQKGERNKPKEEKTQEAVVLTEVQAQPDIKEKKKKKKKDKKSKKDKKGKSKKKEEIVAKKKKKKKKSKKSKKSKKDKKSAKQKKGKVKKNN